jgi:hypothetical protein
MSDDDDTVKVKSQVVKASVLPTEDGCEIEDSEDMDTEREESS